MFSASLRLRGSIVLSEARYGVFVAGGACAGVFEKSTVGACWLAGSALKYFLALAPVTFAVMTCGKRRMYAL